jgi:hypothetical protein
VRTGRRAGNLNPVNRTPVKLRPLGAHTRKAMEKEQAKSALEDPIARFEFYEAEGAKHPELLVPFDSLPPTLREAAIEVSRSWGRELASLPGARMDVLHAPPAERGLPLAGYFVLRLYDEIMHPSDVQRWEDELNDWCDGGGSDPRMSAFAESFFAATKLYSMPRLAGPDCRCGACSDRWPGRRRRKKKRGRK